MRSEGALERRLKVQQFRLHGERNQTKIAKELGCSQGTISKDWAWLDEQYRLVAANDVVVEKGRLIRAHEELLRVWFPIALMAPNQFERAAEELTGTPAAIPLPGKTEIAAAKIVLKTLEQMARIFGLDSPKSADGAEDIVGLFRRIAERAIAVKQESLANATAIDVVPEPA